MSQVIPEAAVEAAGREFYGDAFDDASGDKLQHMREKMRETLEAAAPRMHQASWTEGYDAAKRYYAAGES